MCRRVRLTVRLAGRIFHNNNWNVNVVSSYGGALYLDESVVRVKGGGVQCRFDANGTRVGMAGDADPVH